MPAGVADLELVAQIHLFTRLNAQHESSLAVQDAVTAVAVERERRSLDVGVIGQEPANRIPGRLLVCGQGHDDVASWRESVALQPNQVRNQDGRARLVVVCATTVEVAVLFTEHKGLDGPVIATGRHDVQVRHQQHGPRHLQSEGGVVAFAPRRATRLPSRGSAPTI